MKPKSVFWSVSIGHSYKKGILMKVCYLTSMKCIMFSDQIVFMLFCFVLLLWFVCCTSEKHPPPLTLQQLMLCFFFSFFQLRGSRPTLTSAAALMKWAACGIRAKLASENAASICVKMKKKSAQTKLILIYKINPKA